MKPDIESNEQAAASVAAIATAFTSARRTATPVTTYPGKVPTELKTAYAIQDHALKLQSAEVGGWKVGRLPPAFETALGIDRLAGPIFEPTICQAPNGEVHDMPVFTGGFAAVEAEYLAVIKRDTEPGRTTWSPEEAADMIGDLRIGLEIASSPLATINELGPPVVVSDFGNNHGLIVGPSIEDWQTRPLDTMTCTSFVDDEEVGQGGAYTLTGGFIRSVQFLLELLASRGMGMRAGQYIATGQTSGIHDVVAGQRAVLDFGRDGRIECTISSVD